MWSKNASMTEITIKYGVLEHSKPRQNEPKLLVFFLAIFLLKNSYYSPWIVLFVIMSSRAFNPFHIQSFPIIIFLHAWLPRYSASFLFVFPFLSSFESVPLRRIFQLTPSHDMSQNAYCLPLMRATRSLCELVFLKPSHFYICPFWDKYTTFWEIPSGTSDFPERNDGSWNTILASV